MLKNSGTTIYMDEKNYGLGLPITILNQDKFIEPTDTVLLGIKQSIYTDELILKKTFTDLQADEEGNFVIILDFTKEESEQLTKGEYVYFIDVFRDGVYLDTKLKGATFIVEEV